MPVVSISLDEKLLEKLENLEQEYGFSGRSDVIRTAIRDFIAEKDSLEDMEGEKTAVINVKHTDDAGLDIHDFQGLIRSQLHDHDQQGNCMQVFIVEGDVGKIQELKNSLESEKEVIRVDTSFA